MAGLKIEDKNLFEIVGKIKATDIINMSFETYVNELYKLTRRIKGFQIALSELNGNPERLKFYKQRAAFVELAQMEVEAGELLLTMFEAEPRYNRAILKIKNQREQSNYNNPNTWEDFISFWEQRTIGVD